MTAAPFLVIAVFFISESSLLERAETGDHEAELRLGLDLMSSKDPSVVRSAIPWLKRAADAGSVIALYKLGCLFVDGEGLPKDPVKGVPLLIQAANFGEKRAMGRLAWIFLKGEGVSQDRIKALQWNRILLAMGDKNAHGNAGVFEEGLTESEKAAASQIAQQWLANHTSTTNMWVEMKH